MISINIPICLTLFRIFMVPFFVIIFYVPANWAPKFCTILFFIASITDWLDGFLARRWKQVTNFGKFLDPVADKIMVITALFLISEYFHVWWITLPASSIIIREIIISALREWIAIISNNRIFISWISKIKTFMQMFSLIALLSRFDDHIIALGIVLLYISMIFTFWSMYVYVYSARFDLFYR